MTKPTKSASIHDQERLKQWKCDTVELAKQATVHRAESRRLREALEFAVGELRNIGTRGKNCDCASHAWAKSAYEKGHAALNVDMANAFTAAGPDLLEAAKLALKFIQGMHSEEYEEVHAYKALQAAVGKAEGKP